MAQAAPGDTIAFQSVTVEEAHQALREQEQLLSVINPGSAT
jgi:allophanate hydrolase subunit 2